MARHPGGRPVKYTKAKIQEIKKKIIEYIDETEIPIAAEFAYMNNIPRQRLYDIEELWDALKKLTEKKEAQLEKKALEGKINSTMAIFSLKQLGWKDKQEIEHSGETKIEHTVNFVSSDITNKVNNDINNEN